jgi:hypothetical protein
MIYMTAHNLVASNINGGRSRIRTLDVQEHAGEAGCMQITFSSVCSATHKRVVFLSILSIKTTIS